MLVIIGANGRLGVEVLRLALERGVAVRPVCRDDRDTRVLDGVVDVQRISYADPDHPASLAPVMQGARQVVICIDPRVAGPGAPMYGDHAGGNCIAAATEAGAEVALYVSVAGGYRWSPSRLNRRAFHLDRWVRRSQGLWSMLRIASFHDEVIEGHVRPPDGGRPHPVPRSSRFSPISRRDAARVIVENLGRLVAGRTIYVGGPRMYYSHELEAAIAPHVVPGSGPKTRFFPLPPGDLAVLPSATRVSAGFVPGETLEEALAATGAAARRAPRPLVAPPLAGDAPADGAPPPPGPAPLSGRPEPGPHPADQGQGYKITQPWTPALRRTIHAQLVEDLARLGLPTDGVQLDLRYARVRCERVAQVHDGELRELIGVRALGPGGEVLHKGGLSFLHDELARELRVWWTRPDASIPEPLWRELDLGVQRRAAADPAFADDPRIRTFPAAS